MMDGPGPFNLAYEASRYLEEIFDWAALEVEKANPANFIVPESRFLH